MFKRFTSIAVILAAAVMSAGCIERIETGTVGLRVDINKQISGTELLEGSWNQTIVGDVLTFPVRDIAGAVENMKPQTSNNVALADMDMWYTYTINPSSVSELWTKRPRSFHLYNKDDIHLMRLYMDRVVTNAALKAIRSYTLDQVIDKREDIESKVRDDVKEQLKADKLDGSIVLTTYQVRNMQIPPQILESFSNVIRSANDLRVKENEVQIARKEAERMAALAQNAEKSIAYMAAQAELNYSEAAKNGKVNTIVVPRDFKGIVNVK